MYSYWGGPESGRIPQDTWDRLEALEQQMQAPIRIIPWDTRRVNENRWPTDHYGEFSCEVAHESGVTLVIDNGRNIDTCPYLVVTEDAYYEVPESRSPWEITLSHEFDAEANRRMQERGYGTTTTFAEINEELRVVNCWPALTSYYNERYQSHVLWELLADAIEEHFGGPPLSDEDREARRNERVLAAFDRYVDRVYSGQVSARRTAIDQHTSAITSAQETIARETAALIQDQALLDALLLVRRNDAGATMRQEFELLQSHPRLAQRNLIGGSKLVLVTNDDLRMTREDTGESRWLGAFEITFDLQSFSIHMRNLNTMRGGRHHPHVPGDGRPCFGSYANSFYELLGQGQLYTCFDLLLQYIETVNLRDEWGRYASYWFEQEDERPLGEAAGDEASEELAEDSAALATA